MTIKRLRTYYLLNQFLQIIFLEKDFEETSEKYFNNIFEIDFLKIDFDQKFEESSEKQFLRQIWDIYLKEWFWLKTMTKGVRIFNLSNEFLAFNF